MLGPSEGGLGGQDAPDGFPASGRNAYPSGANAFFADEFFLSLPDLYSVVSNILSLVSPESHRVSYPVTLANLLEEIST